MQMFKFEMQTERQFQYIVRLARPHEIVTSLCACVIREGDNTHHKDHLKYCVSFVFVKYCQMCHVHFNGSIELNKEYLDKN